MNSIRDALRAAATLAVALVGLALVLFSPNASHVKIGNMSLGGGVARADVPAYSSCAQSADSDSCGASSDCSDCG